MYRAFYVQLCRRRATSPTTLSVRPAPNNETMHNGSANAVSQQGRAAQSQHHAGSSMHVTLNAAEAQVSVASEHGVTSRSHQTLIPLPLVPTLPVSRTHGIMTQSPSRAAFLTQELHPP